MSKKNEAILSIIIVFMMLLSLIKPLNDSITLIISIIVGSITLVVTDLNKYESNGTCISWGISACIWVVILLIKLNIIKF